MQITVAGNKKEVKDDLKLTELFELEQVETPEYVTVSINEELVLNSFHIEKGEVTKEELVIES
jgi:sulfur carrier protein ThiS